jgi:hypothetical protein
MYDQSPAEMRLQDVSPYWRITAIREKITSCFVKQGMSRLHVESLMGQPFGVDSYGPPGQFVTVFSYLASGISITFDAVGQVTGVSR